MATFKALVLSHQKRKDGTYNVKIRVTHNRRHKYLPTPLYAGKDDLTKSLKIKNYLILDATEAMIKDYRTKCSAMGVAVAQYDVDQLCTILNEPDKGEWKVNFFEYAEKFITKGKAQKTQRGYQSALSWLERYAGKNLLLSDINKSFLWGFLSFIEENKDKSNRSVTGNTIAPYVFDKLAAIFRGARNEYNDDELEIMRLPFDPFTKIEIKKPPQAEKRAISVEKIRSIALITDSDRKNSVLGIARDMFILSFCLLGANLVDMYNWTVEQYKDGRITYKRQKTRGRRADGALISIKVEPEIEPLMRKYADPKGEFVFSFARTSSSIDCLHAKIGKSIKEIGRLIGEPDLTFYAARHSWATIALNDAGVDKYTVHEGLNHAGGAMAITDIYIKKDWTRLDKANRAVLDFVQFPPLGGEDNKNPSSEEADEGEPNKITRNNKGD